MTKAATPAHARDCRRSGGVVSVASVAGRGAEIAAAEQRATMHAGAILRKLSDRQRRAIRTREPGHDLGIGVTRTASVRHALGIDFRLRIFRRPNAVDTMATHA